MHAIDGGRIASFTDGGPPVWSVAIVPVPGPKPYTLLLTYGFSQAVCPDALYAGKTYEFSIAVPANCEHHPWAVAALRQLARYQLTSGAELMVGDVMPCQAPITHFPFPPHLRGQLPTTSVDSLVVTSDPVLGTIATSAGPIEVRRHPSCMPRLNRRGRSTGSWHRCHGVRRTGSCIRSRGRARSPSWCRQRRCVRPRRLEVATPGKAASHCASGITRSGAGRSKAVMCC